LEDFRVYRESDFVIAECSSRSFLHNQVRSMVGSLRLVGEGKWVQGDISKALIARDRKVCGPVAPADGLYLTRVDYRPVQVDIDSFAEWKVRKEAQDVGDESET
jgi:tRNA pseudouridine38-40 synthase